MRLILLAALVALPATASSPAAWAAGDRAARAACLRAAGLVDARASAPILFSDTSAKTAILVTGRYPQKFLKGLAGQMLCLYDRRSKRAEVGEAKGWRAP